MHSLGAAIPLTWVWRSGQTAQSRPLILTASLPGTMSLFCLPISSVGFAEDDSAVELTPAVHDVPENVAGVSRGTKPRRCGRFAGIGVRDSLRATAITRMFTSGISEKVIADTSGHRSTKALRCYEHTSEQQQQAVSAVVNQCSKIYIP